VTQSEVFSPEVYSYIPWLHSSWGTSYYSRFSEAFL